MDPSSAENSSVPEKSSSLKLGMSKLQDYINSIKPSQWKSEMRGVAKEVLSGIAEDGGFAGLSHKGAETAVRSLLTANALVSSEWGQSMKTPGTVDSVRKLAPETAKLINDLTSDSVNDPVSEYLGNYTRSLLRLVLVPTVNALEEQTGVAVHQITTSLHPDDALKFARLFQASKDTVKAVWHNMTGSDNEKERSLAVERILDESKGRTKFPSSEAVIDRTIYGKLDKAEHGIEQFVKRSSTKLIKRLLADYRSDEPSLENFAVVSDQMKNRLTKESLISVPEGADAQTLKDTAAKSDKLVQFLMKEPKKFAVQFNRLSPEGLLARRQERQKNAI